MLCPPLATLARSMLVAEACEPVSWRPALEVWQAPPPPPLRLTSGLDEEALGLALQAAATCQHRCAFSTPSLDVAHHLGREGGGWG